MSGGVWRTLDGGNSWSPLIINFELPFICTLAMGFVQVNVVIPAGLAPGAQPVVLVVGDNISSAIVTVWLK